jgi:hypothetical protein
MKKITHDRCNFVAAYVAPIIVPLTGLRERTHSNGQCFGSGAAISRIRVHQFFHTDTDCVTWHINIRVRNHSLRASTQLKHVDTESDIVGRIDLSPPNKALKTWLRLMTGPMSLDSVSESSVPQNRRFKWKLEHFLSMSNSRYQKVFFRNTLFLIQPRFRTLVTDNVIM